MRHAGWANRMLVTVFKVQWQGCKSLAEQNVARQLIVVFVEGTSIYIWPSCRTFHTSDITNRLLIRWGYE